jgi:hypothetical protein
MNIAAAQAPAATPPPGADNLTWARPRLLFAVVIATMAALFAATLALPHDPYIRYQQLAKTIQFRDQWVYERIALDRTPIDVAIVGNSRVQAGISGPALQDALRRATGKPLYVANLGMPQEGRNIHYATIKRLLVDHPEVKLIVLSVIEEMPRQGHPAFRDLADTGDIIAAPKLFNFEYVDDVAVLPYRQISLFVQSLAPALFGDATRLDPRTYPGSNFDSTKTLRLPDGRIVERDRIVDPVQLAANAAKVRGGRKGQLLPDSLADYEFAKERTYTRRIAELAREHHVSLLFVHLPVYQDEARVRDMAFYQAFGPVLRPDFMADNYQLYSDYGHANVNGTRRVTNWLANAITDDTRLKAELSHVDERGPR